ncbi:P-loop containing nucleoside triphosphate hydrolase protein [Gautieria morchelliformis]|nr:P-loop containing nucleoside triphosphate hydrolase protein [Gautieria morchelliformis]
MLPWSIDVAALMGGLTVSVLTPILWDGLKLLVLGSVLETTRKIFYWLIDRFKLRWSISAQFGAGDICQEWLVNYLVKENIWSTPRNMWVRMKSNKRKWKLQTGTENDQVDFIPEYGSVQFFRWRGYWLEVSRLKTQVDPTMRYIQDRADSRGWFISLTIFTLDVSVLYAFVEECRLKYAEDTKSEVAVYTFQGSDLMSRSGWSHVNMMRRRPLDSLLLDKNTITSLLDDAREFLSAKTWYTKAGIPHRRGYLLHGPPGTGKTSTIYTVAGELGLELFVLSLSSKSMDDTRLARAVSFLPTRAILVLEDIDCAFPSRSDWDGDEFRAKPWHLPNKPRTSQVTMSGILNMLDGIGSEEGKIFFATTNHIDRLDPALIRPGRIDVRIEYRFATRQQAEGLFLRFFPEFMFPTVSSTTEESPVTKESQTLRLADEFSSAIPPGAFSMAELQGYLIQHKTAGPLEAARLIQAWVTRELKAKGDLDALGKLRKAERWQQQLLRSGRRSPREEAMSSPPVLTPNLDHGEGQSEHLPPGGALTTNPESLEKLSTL